ncbi:amino acid adenylation domain-containing protein [Paenibacillus dendritiformis]|uniref:amino acid adenylation domain-containing protein n=1 Tax=Paenibacillus dendritiformis TaxID=130049 RepID=UPI00387E123D
MPTINHQSLVEHLRYNSEANTTGIFFIEGETEIYLSYEELWRQANYILKYYQDRGIRPKEEVILQIENNMHFITHFWACLLGGIIPVPVSVGSGEEYKEKIINIWSVLHHPYIVTTSQLNEQLFNYIREGKPDLWSEIDKRTLIVQESYERVEGQVFMPELEDIAFIQFSSGSTGDPKGVTLKHRNLLTNIAQIIERTRIDERDSFLSWLPLTHDMGMIGMHLVPLVANIKQCLLPTSFFTRNPMQWFKQIHLHKVTMTGSPNFGYQLFTKHFKPNRAQLWDLSHVRYIFNGAEPISAKISHAFLDLLSPYGLKYAAMWPCYGLAEACLGVTSVAPDTSMSTVSVSRTSLGIGMPVIERVSDDFNTIEFMEVGTPFEGCLLRICDEENVSLGEGYIGYIQVKGENITEGYYNNIQATQKTIHNGWLNTGDLGFIRNGQLVITGRAKDIIIIRGQNIYPHDIERLAENINGIKANSVVACGVYDSELQTEQMILFVSYRRKIEDFLPLTRDLKSHITQKTGLSVDRVIPIRSIPKTTSGKVQRYKLRERYEKGDFQSLVALIEETEKVSVLSTVCVVPEDEKVKKILEICREIFAEESLEIHDNLFNHGLHSIKLIQLASKLGEHFGVEISMQKLAELTTVHEIAASILPMEYEPASVEMQPLEELAEEVRKDQPFALTEIQKAYLLGRREQYELGGGSTHYYLEIETSFDLDTIQDGLNVLIRRHPMLRAIFSDDGSQRILETVPEYRMNVFDASKQSAAVRNDQIKRNRERMSHQVFDPELWPLFEFAAVKGSATTSTLFFSIDMLIADGASIQVIGTELNEYCRGSRLVSSQENFTFQDYIRMYYKMKQSEHYEVSKAYWLNQIDDIPQAPQIPLKNDPSAIKRPIFKRLQHQVSNMEWNKLKTAAHKNHITPTAMLCSVYAEILAYWSNQDRLTINLTAFNRYPFHESINRMVGDFTSLILMKFEMSTEESMVDRAKSIQRTLFEALEHRHYDGVELIRDIARHNHAGNKAIMPVVFTSLLFDDESDGWFEFGEILTSISQTSQVYLDNQIIEVNGSLVINWDYAEELFESHLIEQMFDHYTRRITDFINEGKPSCSFIELEQFVERYNDTSEHIPCVTLQKLFAEQAHKNPDNIAVHCGTESLTYRELDEQSNQVAHYLIDHGIRNEKPVGVWAYRTTGTIINILGILKAGGSYVPLDPEFPAFRIDAIRNNCGFEMALNPDFSESSEVKKFSRENLLINGDIDDIAYIIYTSGSTGVPKGVVIQQQAAVNTILDINRKFSVTEKDRILGLSSFCFDLSVYDLFGAFSTGAALIVAEDQRDFNEVTRLLKQQRISIWNSVPAIMNLMIDYLRDDSGDFELRLVLLSGDKIPRQLPSKVKEKFDHSTIVSLGGATEASIWSIYYNITHVKDEWNTIPYGVPLANQTIYVLNQWLDCCPVGVPGEIYIGGHGLAQEYRNDKERTSKSFIHHPLLGRLYRTGDYGVMKKERYVEYIGRKDFQVKISGHRIELSEIESRLLACENLEHAVVIDIEDMQGRKYLCAYYIAGKLVDSSTIRKQLSEILPGYMIPRQFIQLETIPLTSNGKVDRKTLIDIAVQTKLNTEQELETAKNNEELELCKIWIEVFGLEQISVSDDFFALGGDSIKAIQICSKARQINLNVSITDVYNNLTIRKLAAAIKGKTCKIEVSQKEVIGEVELTPIQHWFFEQNNPFENYWNFTRVFRIGNDVDLKLLEAAFKVLIQHHDSLRTVFRRENGIVTQFVLPFDKVNFSLETIDLSEVEESVSNRKLHEIGEVVQSQFDLEKGPLVRAIVVDLGKSGKRLVVPIHHLIVDVISWSIIIEDIETLYSSGNTASLPLKTSSFQEWSWKLQDYSKNGFLDTSYWKNITNWNGKAEPLPSLKEFRVEKFDLDLNQTKQILEISKKSIRTGVHEIILATLQMAMVKVLQQKRLLITVEGHGRGDLFEDIDISRTVGWFTCEYPIVLESKKGALAALRHVEEQMQRVPRSGIDFGVSRYLAGNLALQELNPDIAFNYLGETIYNNSANRVILGEAQEDFGPIIHPENYYKHQLYILCRTIDNRLVTEFIYNTNLYAEETIMNLRQTFIYSLEELAEELAEARDYGTDFDHIYPLEEPDPSRVYEPFGLTSVQQAYLMGRNRHFELGGFSTHYYAEFETNMELDGFNQSLRNLIERHPMLRTIIHPNGKQQILHSVGDYEMGINDIRELNIEDQLKSIESIRNRMSHHTFASDQWPLFEFLAVRLTDERSLICVGFDLMIADGASFIILLKELVEYYESPEYKPEPLHFTFRDYMTAYEQFKQSPLYMEDRKYWLDKMEGFPSAPMLPVKIEPSAVEQPYFRRKQSVINKSDWEKIKSIARSKHLTPSTILCTVYAEVLAYWSNQQHLALNLTVFNRYPFHPGVKDIIGDFTSIILLDVHLGSNHTFWENAVSLQTTLMNALAHRHYDGVEFIRELSRDQKLENKAAMPVVFTSMLFDEVPATVSQIFKEMKYGISQTPQVYLDLQVMEIDSQLSVSWDYVEQLFSQEVIDMMFNQYIDLLQNLVEFEGRVEFDLSCGDRQLIESYIQTDEVIEAKLLHELVSDQAMRTPEKLAVVLGNQKLTYQELEFKSNQIAHALAERKIGPGQFIGIHAQRDVYSMLNIIGVLKTGAAYVPIDPNYPDVRQEYIRTNSNCKIVLEPDFYSENDIETYEGTPLLRNVDLDAVAYIIYTSGSTGQPKGVVISHRAVSNTIVDINRKIGMSEKDSILGLSSMCFDLSVFDIFGALSTGATLVMLHEHRDSKEIKKAMDLHGITIWNSVPSLMELYIKDQSTSALNQNLRFVLLSGDWIPTTLPHQIEEHFPCATMFSLGGATEASIWSIYYPIERRDIEVCITI